MSLTSVKTHRENPISEESPKASGEFRGITELFFETRKAPLMSRNQTEMAKEGGGSVQSRVQWKQTEFETLEREK